MQYWLMKSEPGEFSVDDLAARPDKTEPWDGIRNYQARNFIRDVMNRGDLALFYHSSCAEPGVVGIMRVVSEAYPDPTAIDPNDKHYDAKSDPSNPRWFLVDVKLVRKLKRVISLTELKSHSALEDMALLRRGNRLSVMPVTKSHWDYLLALERK